MNIVFLPYDRELLEVPRNNKKNEKNREQKIRLEYYNQNYKKKLFRIKKVVRKKLLSDG